MLFGDTVTITADGPWQHLLYQLTGRKWGNLDVENETGCGIVPYVYKEKNLVNAVQWAVGLELLLLIDDPWRIYLTTDHPNGGVLLALPGDHPPADGRGVPQGADQEAAGRGAASASCCRNWTASTRCPRSPSSPRPVRRGAGAAAEGAPRRRAPTRTWRSIDEQPRTTRRMFSYPRYVIKGGEVVVEEGEIRDVRRGQASSSSSPAYDEKIEEYIRPLFQQHYTMSFDNYPVEIERVHGLP